MDVTDLTLPGAKILTPRRFSDERGYFCESYNEQTFAELGIHTRFVQDNHSLSIPSGTVRGLHYQSPPHAQTKLIRVVSGSILDVIVDIRIGSPAYGQHVGVELSAANGCQLLVPEGFLHGFVTRSANTEVCYKVDAHYSQPCDGSVRWNDPVFGIDWGVAAPDAKISEKDLNAPLFSAFESPFNFSTHTSGG